MSVASTIAHPGLSQIQLYVTVPTTNPPDDAMTFDNYAGRAWSAFKVGVPAVIRQVDAQGHIPATHGLPNLNNLPASPGDWLVPLDTNNDGVADSVVLVRQVPEAAGGKVVGEWSSTSSVGGAAGQDYHIATVNFHAVPGKKYLVLVSANGFLDGRHGRQYRIYVGGHTIAEQELKAHRGGWDALIAMPVVMSAVFTATSDSHPNAILSCQTEAGDADWLLNTGHHTMTIVELGA